MTLVDESAKRKYTERASFSFYVTAASSRITQAALFGDALTVAGPKGPAAIKKLRAYGFEKPVLFDGTGYAGNDLDPTTWVRAQRAAGSDRELLPGIFLPWDRDGNSSLETAVREQASIARDLGATLLLALDGRWIAKRHSVVVDALLSAGRPAALVLADARDPLALAGAIGGIRALGQRVPSVSLLRCDHGALGLVAAGGAHASIGLTATTRHFVASGMSAYRVGDDTARLFLLRLLDWFRAAEVAGWSAAGLDARCHLECCHGEPLARYLDEDNDAVWHNMNALAALADHVLNAEPQDRLVEYLTVCRAAVERYGLAGMHGPEVPKAQLKGWVFS